MELNCRKKHYICKHSNRVGKALTTKKQWYGRQTYYAKKL